MEIAHVIQSLSATYGGPQAAAMSLAAEQAMLGNRVHIISGAEKNASSWWEHWRSQDKRLDKVTLQLLPQNIFGYRQRLRVMRSLGTQVDVLHLHGLWRSLAWIALSLPRQHARTILAPHGMLSSWSLEQKPLRKRVALRLGWRRAITGASAIQVLNDAERDEVANRFPNTRVEILPNGVAAEALALPAKYDRDPLNDGGTANRYVLFLARLHHVKGPDRLLEAFSACLQLEPALATYRLIFAGSDAGMLPKLQARAAQLGIADRVEFIGHVSGAKKETLLQCASVLCQPSHHEGFSVSLLEALAAGIPVVTTPNANFPEITQSGSGIVCAGSPEPLANALLAICSDDALRARMGAAGRELVARRYTWERIAKRSLEIYKSLEN